MKKLLIAGIAAAAICVAPAMAADMPQPEPVYKAHPPAPVFSWTGCYIGADAGGLWSNGKEVDPGFTAPHLNPSGGSFGGHVGCEYQFDPRFVVGVEGDFNWLHGNSNGPYFTDSTGALTGNGGQLKLRDNGSVRGIFGFAVDRTLFYGTAGAAWMSVNGCELVPTTGPCFPGNGAFGTSIFSGTLSGWTVGAGIAYAFTPNIIGRIEYLYADYGTKTFSTPVFLPFGTNVSLRTDTVRVGLSWLFSSGR